MKPQKTWIVIANGGEARIYLNEGRLDGVHEIDGMAFHTEHLPAREIMADRPGRSFDSVGGGRHAMEDPSDPAEQREAEFARQIADATRKGLSEHRYNRLSVVASPAMLAHLRQALPADVRARVHAEIDKDYTKTPITDLADLLRRVNAID
ncbi:MAG: host attachment protein [Aestuariivirgaceae bacterium]